MPPKLERKAQCFGLFAVRVLQPEHGEMVFGSLYEFSFRLKTSGLENIYIRGSVRFWAEVQIFTK